MPDPREVLAAALAEQSPDDDDLRDWLTDRAEFVEDALAAAGLHVCAEGQAVVDGAVVTLQRGAIDAYDSPLGPNFIEFYADTAGDYFRIEEAPGAR